MAILDIDTKARVFLENFENLDSDTYITVADATKVYCARPHGFQRTIEAHIQEEIYLDIAAIKGVYKRQGMQIPTIQLTLPCSYGCEDLARGLMAVLHTHNPNFHPARVIFVTKGDGITQYFI